MKGKKITISKKELHKLYYFKNYSVFKIAKFYNCGSQTIYNRLHKFNIPLKHERIKISKKELHRLYNIKNKSTLEIAKIYNCNFQTICNRLNEFNIPRKSKSQARMRYLKYDFSENLTEKAYLIGFRLGDLSVYKTTPSAETVVVNTHTTRQEQVDLFKNLFRKYGKISIYAHRSGSLSVNCFLNTSFHFLLPKKDWVEQWIRKNNIFLAAFVAGYIDAEGTFGVYQGRARFKVDSYDKEILLQTYKWLSKDKINCKFFQIGRKGEMRSAGYRFNNDLWRLNINESKSLFRFINIIKPFLKHRKRVKDMKRALNNIKIRKQKGTIRWTTI